MNTNGVNITHKRRMVIVLQLSVLVFILVGLFGSLAFGPAEGTGEEIDLDTVAITKPATEEWEQLSKTEVRAKAAYVYDVSTGEVIFEKNGDQLLPLASITKLMTSMLSYELLEYSENGSINSRALQQSGSTGFSEGEVISLRNLNRLALISSSNDAAYAIAATVGSTLGSSDPAAQFVAGMNIRAEEIGLDSLLFKNPTGLDVSETEPGAVGSAKDVSLLLSYILKNYPEIVEPTQLSSARVYSESGGFHDVENTNEALYAIPNLVASKTGYTDLAGGNLTIAFDAGFGRTVIVTVLGSTRNERFSDALRIVNAVRSDIKSQ